MIGLPRPSLDVDVLLVVDDSERNSDLDTAPARGVVKVSEFDLDEDCRRLAAFPKGLAL